jgi:hypothetical protein
VEEEAEHIYMDERGLLLEDEATATRDLMFMVGLNFSIDSSAQRGDVNLMVNY